jgi:peptide-methionine (S)-S-oxide reductase
MHTWKATLRHGECDFVAIEIERARPQGLPWTLRSHCRSLLSGSRVSGPNPPAPSVGMRNLSFRGFVGELDPVVFRHLAAILALVPSALFASQPQQSAAPSASKPSDEVPKKDGGDVIPTSPGDKKDAPKSKAGQKPRHEQATFGAGCFWHVEDVFEHQKGVNSAVSGYAGGNVAYPSYEMVHEGVTGHAEVVMVDFDPDVISYEELLNVFWKSHDPTSINRQGEDEGPQYRTVIFYHSEEQRRAALKSYRALTEKRVFRAPIVTQLMPLRAFYQAEDYHQDYYGGKPRATARRRRTTGAKVKKSRGNSPPSTTPASPKS